MGGTSHKGKSCCIRLALADATLISALQSAKGTQESRKLCKYCCCKGFATLLSLVAVLQTAA